MKTALLRADVETQQNPEPDVSQVRTQMITLASAVSLPVSVLPDDNSDSIVYTNDDGKGLLSTLQTLQITVHKLNERLDELEEEVKIVHKIEEEVKIVHKLEEEVKILQPLQSIAVSIRERFFVLCARNENRRFAGNDGVINYSNRSAHRGDVVTDVSLFSHGLLKFSVTFNFVYGVKWDVAAALIKYKHIVKAMDKRALIVADRSKTWRAEKPFRTLLKWTESSSVSENEKEGLADETERKTIAGTMLAAVLFNREVNILY